MKHKDWAAGTENVSGESHFGMNRKQVQGPDLAQPGEQDTVGQQGAAGDLDRLGVEISKTATPEEDRFKNPTRYAGSHVDAEAPRDKAPDPVDLTNNKNLPGTRH